VKVRLRELEVSAELLSEGVAGAVVTGL